MCIFRFDFNRQNKTRKKLFKIIIKTILQIKAINEINLNEEYMDASLVITMEWIDNALSWETGKTSATTQPTSTSANSTSSASATDSASTSSENDPAQNSTNTQDSKEIGLLAHF